MILSSHFPLMSGVCVCVCVCVCGTIHQLWSPVPATVFLIIGRLVLRYIFKFSLHLCHTWYATLYAVDTQKVFAKLKGVCVYVLSHFSHVWLFGTPWTVARQTPLPMGSSRQEYWSGLPNAPVGMATYRDVFVFSNLNACFHPITQIPSRSDPWFPLQLLCCPMFLSGVPQQKTMNAAHMLWCVSGSFPRGSLISLLHPLEEKLPESHCLSLPLPYVSLHFPQWLTGNRLCFLPALFV